MLSNAAIDRIQQLVKEYPNTKSALVPALYVAQRDNGGWLSRAAMVEVAEELSLPESHVFGVATFYSMFYFEPVGKHLVQVCGTSPCRLRGAEDAIDCFKRKLGIEVGQTTEDGLFTLQEVECMAACHLAPMAQINEDYFFHLTEARIDEIIEALRRGVKPEYAEFEKSWLNAHPIALTDEELGIDVSHLSPAAPIEKKEKPAAPVAATA
jgi:NADH-quinone oxidoreductase E subunit